MVPQEYHAKLLRMLGGSGPRILVFTSGAITVNGLQLRTGAAAYTATEDPSIVVTGDGQVFQAASGYQVTGSRSSP